MPPTAPADNAMPTRPATAGRSGRRAAAAASKSASDSAGATTRATRRAPRKALRAAGQGDTAAVRVLAQFRVVFNAVKTHFQQVERRAGLGGAQVWALSLVRDHPGLGVNDLAAAMSVRQPTASNLVKALAQQALIEPRRDGPDRRAVQLRILPAGHRLLRRVPGPFAGVLPAALEGLPPEVLQRLERDLAVLVHALGADEGAASVPLAQL